MHEDLIGARGGANEPAMFEREILWRSPLAAFAPLAEEPYAALLHGGELATNADWSIIVAEPTRRIEFAHGACSLGGAAPFQAIADLRAARRRDEKPACGAPFATGLVGFIGYECGAVLEPSAAGPRSPYSLPDMAIGAYDAAAAFDRGQRRAFVLGRTQDVAASLFDRLGKDEVRSPVQRARAEGSNFTPEAYRTAVCSVIERIRDGEIFQANISQRLRARLNDCGSLYGLFCAASGASTARFGAFLQTGRGEIVSLSPERFFGVRDRKITAEPIKGTRPRGGRAEEDRALAESLRSDPKDRAENMMIADLTRSDLSRVCADCTITEEALCELVSHANVHHLVSRISGTLAPGLSAADALPAFFPCGSVTGAPKVQAMKVIGEIEKSGRGPYCGAILYIDDSGAADVSVAIRLAIGERAGNDMIVSVPVGGGITIRSDPESERLETMAKGRPLLAALGLSEIDFE